MCVLKEKSHEHVCFLILKNVGNLIKTEKEGNIWYKTPPIWRKSNEISAPNVEKDWGQSM